MDRPPIVFLSRASILRPPRKLVFLSLTDQNQLTLRAFFTDGYFSCFPRGFDALDIGRRSQRRGAW
eukprot:6093630-Pyramimonas_sp.AAC.1